MVVVDTSVWIDYFRGARTPQVTWLQTELAQQRLGVLDLCVCEILQGVDNETEATRVTAALERFEVMTTGGIDLAKTAARNCRTLRTKGRTVRKTIDCLIATFCIDRGHALLHADADFEPFELHLGLRVVR